MKRCLTYQKWMAERYLGTLDVRREAELREHLQSCAVCRKEELRVDALIRAIRSEKRNVPERFWASFWLSVEKTIREKEAIRRRYPAGQYRVWARWPVQLAAAILLLIAGGLIGRFLLTPNISGEMPQKEARVAEEEVLEETIRYLERSKILLLGLVNLDITQVQSEKMDFSYEQQMSVLLVKQLPKLRTRLEQMRRTQLLELLEDLEIVLLQIANADEIKSATEIELIQNGIRARAILFKINVEEMLQNEHRKEIHKENSNI